MKRKTANNTIIPRKLPRALPANAELESAALTKQYSFPKQIRLRASTLERIAIALRTGELAERIDEAAKLEAMVAHMEHPTDARRGARATYLVSGHGWRKVMTRAEAAKQLGIRASSLSSLLSRKHGRAEFARRDEAGNPELVVVSVGNKRIFRKAERPE